MTASVLLRLPRLGALPVFRALCKQLRLQAVRGIGEGGSSSEGLWEVQNLERLGSSEVEQVNAVIAGCRVLLGFEDRLSQGEEVTLDDMAAALSSVGASSAPVIAEAVFSDVPGLGEDDRPGFPADSCPAELPDLSRHFSLATDALKHDPAIFASLKDLSTEKGVTLARCIKTGIDNPGHPMIKTDGIVAGDAESYDLFAPLFTPVIHARHPRYKPEDAEPKAAAVPESVTQWELDPPGKYVVAVQVRGERNLRNLRFPPAASRQDRCEAERLLTGALARLAGELEGEYLPLRGSGTYPGRPAGMSPDEEARLAEKDLLLRAPDAALLLSSGVGRCWPEARGVFVNSTHSLAAWINEENHLRLMSLRSDGNLEASFRLFSSAERAIREALEAEGSGFAFSDRLGFLTTSPSSLGSALHVEARVRLPLVSAAPNFKALCRQLGVQARAAPVQGDAGEGLWDVFCRSQLGASELQQLSALVEAVRKLVDMEADLAKEAVLEPNAGHTDA